MAACAEKHFIKMGQRIVEIFNSEQLMDVVLVAGRRRIYAHKLVLSAASDYFRNILSTNSGEQSGDEITLKVDENILQDLISFCYTGDLQLTDETVGSYLGVASFLKITEAVEQCCEFLTSRMSVETCLGCFHLADIHKRQDMWNESLKFIKENFERVMEEKAFLLLSFDDLSLIVASDDLVVSSEAVVFNGLKRWMEDDQSRNGHALDLLRLAKLELLSTQFLQQNVENHEAFCNFPCMKVIAEAYRKQAIACNCSSSSLKRNPTVLEQVTGTVYYANNDWIEELDTHVMQWRRVMRVPKNRIHYGSTIFEGKIFVVGGKINCEYTASSEYFDIATNEWKDLAPLRKARYYAGVVSLNGCIYAVGGSYRANGITTVERLNPKTLKWESVADLLKPLRYPRVAVLSDQLYVIYYEDQGMERYDVTSNAWSELATPSDNCRFMGVADGVLFALTCARKSSVYSFVRYNAFEDSWYKDGISLRLESHPEKLITVGKKFYLPLSECGDVKRMCIYDTEKSEWTPEFDIPHI